MEYSKTTMIRSGIVGLALLAFFSASAWAENGRIAGLPPAVANSLPGISHLFNLRNASAPPQIVARFKLGEVIARFQLEMSDEEIEQVTRQSGALKATRISPLGLYLLKGPPSVAATQRLMDRLWSTHTTVDMVPNYLGGGLTVFPNDPRYTSGDQWYIEQPSDIDLDLTKVWEEFTRGSSAVVVAHTDSGVDIDHEEFLGRLFVNPGEIPGNNIDDDGNGYTDDVSGWNSIADPPNGDVNDLDVGHGTWTASILMANTDNLFQVAGVDHFCKLLPLRMVASNTDSTAQLFALIAALDYLVVNPTFAQVVNMSVAGYSSTPMLRDVLSAAATTYILIGGSGNTSGEDACRGLPNSHPDVITIGATDRTDALGAFSSTGTCLDFVAPGVAIHTASFDEPTNPLAVHVDDGASLAVPMVSGMASLGLAVSQFMTRSDFYAALKASAVDLGAPGKDIIYGWGRVNAYGAVDSIQRIFEDGFESGDTTKWN